MGWRATRAGRQTWQAFRADWVAIPREVRARFAWTLTFGWLVALIATGGATALLRGERGERLDQREAELLPGLVQAIPLDYSLAVFFESPGNGVVLLPLTLVAAVALARRRRPLEAVAVLAATLLAATVVGLGWTVWERGRPDFIYPGLPPSGMSAFPSGHAAMGISFYGLLAYLWLRGSRSTGERVFGVLAAAVVVAAAVAARVVLSGHWPSDVVAGMAIGLFWLGVIIHALRVSASQLSTGA
jgi:undecaprenyl-diphosphatase